jgi:hypothetical protein
MYEAQPKKETAPAGQRDGREELPAEIECWLIDDFVDLLPQDRRAHLGQEPVW